MFENLKKRIATSWGFEEAGAAKRDPKKVGLKKVGSAIRTSGAQYEFSIVDLMEMSRAYYTDSYIRRAVDKYAELIFKAGWDITGKNQAAVDYVWLRFKLMAEATRIPMDDFLKQTAMDLVLYGNAFIAKQRAGNLPPGVKAQGYLSNKPVLGYFNLAATSMMISRDATGAILGYQQNAALGGSAGGGGLIQIKPEDMVHFYYKKQTGRGFGIPFAWNVLDDVKILRQLEENVARLIYRNLFPLYQYQVGLEKPGFEATDEEIEDIRQQIRDMPMDGGIVVPERHNITVVSNNQAAMDASPYLQYFRERVFSGLMISGIIMGIGDTGSGTADNLAAEMVDGVKEFQNVFKMIFNSGIVNEILFEGGFDPVANPDDEVDFVFPEIELDAKIKKENHAVQLFTQNAITHEEMRQEMGLDPVADESRLMFNMITAALNAEMAAAKIGAANNAGDNKNKPANQHGKQPSPGKPKRSKTRHSMDEEDLFNEGLEDEDEEFSTNSLTEVTQGVTLPSESGISSKAETLTKSWRILRDDVVRMVKEGKELSYMRAFALELTRQKITTRVRNHLTDSYLSGISSAQAELGFAAQPTSNNVEIEKLMKRSKIYVDRLMNDVTDLVTKALKEADPTERISKIMGAFTANEYRLPFLLKTETARAFNYGRILAAKSNKVESVKIISDSDCAACKAKHGEQISLNQPSLLEAIPPFHPNCSCVIEFVKPSGGGSG